LFSLKSLSYWWSRWFIFIKHDHFGRSLCHCHPSANLPDRDPFTNYLPKRVPSGSINGGSLFFHGCRRKEWRDHWCRHWRWREGYWPRGCRHCHGQDAFHVGTANNNGEKHADLAWRGGCVAATIGKTHPMSRSRLSHWRDTCCPALQCCRLLECSVAGVQELRLQCSRS